MYQLVVQDVSHARGCSWIYLTRSHDPEKDHINTNLDMVSESITSTNSSMASSSAVPVVFSLIGYPALEKLGKNNFLEHVGPFGDPRRPAWPLP